MPGPTGTPVSALLTRAPGPVAASCIVQAPRPCVPAREVAVRRVEGELPDLDGREAAAEGLPALAAVVGDEGADVGAGIERVRIARVDLERVDRGIREVGADVRPVLAAVGGLEDVTRTARRACVEAVEGDVGDPVVRRGRRRCR